MKDEYIRKQDAIDAIHCDIKITGRENAETVCKTIESFTDGIKSIEPADVVPVVHGRWIEEWWHGDKTRKCSVCNLTQTVNVYKGEVKFNYCPYCGAKMDKE